MKGEELTAAAVLEGIRLRAGVEPRPEIVRDVERMRALSHLSELAALHYDQLKAAILVPASKFDYSQATALRMSLRNRLQDAVGRIMGQATIIRDLAAYDISGAAAGAAGYARLSNVNALVANTWKLADLSKALDQATSIGIYGYVQLAKIPQIDAIAFFLGSGVPLCQFWLDAIYADQQSNIGYFDPPVVFAPGQTAQVNLLANAAVVAAAEQYGLLGYTAEPQARTVSPDQSNLI
jgi:hypothetical protein